MLKKLLSKQNLTFSAIGIINGLIFTCCVIYLLHFKVLPMQKLYIIDNVINNINLFIQPLRLYSLPESKKQPLIDKIKSLNIYYNQKKIDDYNNKFNTFFLITIILSFIIIVILSILLIVAKMNKIFYIDWILEIVVTLVVIIILYNYFNNISNKYILGNIGYIFK